MTQKLKNSIENGYSVNIGQYVSRGLNIMQSNMGGYIGYGILAGLITIILSFIPVISFFASLIITPCIIFGFHLVSNTISTEKISPEFGTFFSGFNHFGQIVVVVLLEIVIYIIISIPFLLVTFSSLMSLLSDRSLYAVQNMIAGVGGIALLLFFFAYIYISICLMFATLIAVFHNESPLDAIKLSWKVINKNWFMVFLFVVVNGLIMISGVLLLLVGALFTIPLYYCILYAAFEDICGTSNEEEEYESEISSIGTQL
jgi:hypothetical protein